jgi:flavin-dependent dehydrogenase
MEKPPMEMVRSEIAIVGAGPAGCAAALALAEAGRSAVAIERGRPGKDKACGDAYTPGAVEALYAYGLTPAILADLGGRPYRQNIISGYGEHYVSEDEGDISGWVIRRATVDQWLRDRVAEKMTIWYETSVTAIQAHGGEFSLMLRTPRGEERLQSSAVVLATGAANHLSRAWGIAGEPILGASLSLYANAGSEAPEGLDFCFDEISKPGYAWIFPMCDRINVGVCALGPQSAETLRQRAVAFAQRWQPLPGTTWRGGGHALWSRNGTAWHHVAGIVSCGDAAGLTDPISAEGITAALLSGRQAGLAIARYLDRGRDEQALHSYSAWVREFGVDRYESISASRLLWNIWAGTVR